jgi:hypothetical protein
MQAFEAPNLPKLTKILLLEGGELKRWVAEEEGFEPCFFTFLSKVLKAFNAGSFRSSKTR